MPLSLPQYLYDVMDPDKDTVATRQLNRKQLLDTERKLLLQVERILVKANYYRVSPSLIPDTLLSHSQSQRLISPYSTLDHAHISGPTPSTERPVKRS